MLVAATPQETAVGLRIFGIVEPPDQAGAHAALLSRTPVHGQAFEPCVMRVNPSLQRANFFIERVRLGARYRVLPTLLKLRHALIVLLTESGESAMKPGELFGRRALRQGGVCRWSRVEISVSARRGAEIGKPVSGGDRQRDRFQVLFGHFGIWS